MDYKPFPIWVKTTVSLHYIACHILYTVDTTVLHKTHQIYVQAKSQINKMQAETLETRDNVGGGG